MKRDSNLQEDGYFHVPAIFSRKGKFTVDIPADRLPFNSVLGLFGPSGSGKTTYANKLLKKLGPCRVTLLPQADSLLNDLTAEQNVRLLSDPMFSQKEVEDNIARLAERLKIKSRLSAFASDLSGGERRRVLIMRSLLSSCEMLIIDEPFAGLGWGDEVRAREVVRSSRERYRLILVISHSAELIWSLCNYIWIVNNGSRVAILSNSAPADNLPAMLSFEQADSLGVSNLIGARELADYIDSDDGLARFREQNATLGFWTSHSSLTDHRVEKHGGICGLLKSEKVLISRHFLRGERRVELRLRDQVACPPIVLRDQTSGASDNEAWVNIDTVISIK